MHPRADHWVKIMLIKKKIKSKGKQLKKYKQQARKRLRSLLKLRTALLNNLRSMIDMKLEKTKESSKERSKAVVGRMLHSHRNWLLSWNKMIKVQEKKIKELQEVQLNWDERLLMLRRQFRMLPNRWQVLQRFFRKFRSALKNPNLYYGTKEEAKREREEWKSEVQQIRKYFVHWRGKRLRQKKTKAVEEYIDQFTTFWEAEVLRKNDRKYNPHHLKSLKDSNQLAGKTNLKMRRKIPKKYLKAKIKGEAVKKYIGQVEQFLETKVVRKKGKIYTPSHMKTIKTIDVQLDQDPNHLVVKYKQKSGRKIPEKQLEERIEGEAVKEYVDQFNKFWKSEVFRRKGKKYIPLYIKSMKSLSSMKSIHVQLDPKTNQLDVNLKRKSTRKTTEKFSKAKMEGKTPTLKELYNIEKELKNMVKDDSHRMKSHKVRGRHKVNITLPELLNLDVDLKKKLVTKSGQLMAKKLPFGGDELQRYHQEMQAARREVVKRTVGFRMWPTKKVLRDSKRKLHETETDKGATAAQDQDSKPGTAAEVLAEAEDELKKALVDTNSALLRSVPAGIKQEIKVTQSKTSREISLTKNKRRAGQDLMSLLEMNSNVKYLPLQMFLKEIIIGPSLMDILADSTEVANTVQKHYMWKNLAAVYEDLKSVGLPKSDILKLLKEQYLKYIDEIVNEAIEKGAKILPRKRDSLDIPLDRIDSDVFDLDAASHASTTERLLQEQMARRRRQSALLAEEESRFSRYSNTSLESSANSDLRRVEDGYTPKQLQEIFQAHVRYFKKLQKTPLQQRLEERRLQLERAKSKEFSDMKTSQEEKRERRKKCKANVARLFYAPRRTCRQRQVEQDCEPCECEEDAQERCMTCGIELPALAPSPTSSWAHLSLSSSSIAACANNQQLLHATNDICHLCGFVHDPQASFCPMLGFGCSMTGLQQLRLIKGLERSEDECHIWRAAVRRCESCA